MTESTPAGKDLTARGIPHRVFVHVGPIESLEQAARERSQLPEQVVRSILFRLGADEYALVLVAGPQQIAWPVLRKILGQSRMTMATPEEVLSVTGFVVGSVSPFGLPRLLRILLDRSVLAQEELSIGSGVRGTAIILSSADLQRALGDVEIVDVLPGPPREE